MTDDLVTRLITAADEFIEDPSHESADAAPVLLRSAADEIERLRALITEWADAEDRSWEFCETTFEREYVEGRVEESRLALRKEAGR